MLFKHIFEIKLVTQTAIISKHEFKKWMKAISHTRHLYFQYLDNILEFNIIVCTITVQHRRLIGCILNKLQWV